MPSAITEKRSQRFSAPHPKLYSVGVLIRVRLSPLIFLRKTIRRGIRGIWGIFYKLFKIHFLFFYTLLKIPQIPRIPRIPRTPHTIIYILYYIIYSTIFIIII